MNVELVNPAAVLGLVARPGSIRRVPHYRAFREWVWFGAKAWIGVA